ncbi:hypothetical protein BK649_10685 [Pseudomonas canadensis]|uniref:Uncharacterized protein n=1 Tax=Pseudomonas canadensis TaxID=915099 RepID=A0A423FBP9_9PSED|nr:hypothetical protein BK649_10685 [Pseudomonas canadensis]
MGDNPEQRETIIAGTNNYILWNELLSKISDHSEYDKTTLFQSFIFISEDEKSKKIRKEILLFKPNQEVLSFITSIKEPKYKRDDLESVNIHAFERRSVLRLSLIEELKKHGDNNTFIESLISSPEILFSTFEGNYETYIRKFSLDKLAQEIEKEKLEALEKINNQLQEHQTKSLAIPGILIGTSLIKEWHFGTATLAFMAVAITALIFRLSIKNRRDSILEICDRTKHIIKIVDAEKLENSNLDQSSARALIEETNKSIITKKQAALRTLNYISKLIAISIIFWCVFLLYSVVPNLFFIIERFYPAALASIAPLANEFIYEIQNIYFHSTQSFK